MTTDSPAPSSHLALPLASEISFAELDGAFQAWLDDRSDQHASFKIEPSEFDDKLILMLAFQRELFDAGWARYGWPEENGGLGGTVLHRATIVEVLERNGFPPRHVFEHLDILPPALTQYAQPELLEKVFLKTLRGDVLWCQGFSEPTAGSDLAALRTTARKVDGGYRVDGHKIWTSWAKWATHCFFLARTGSTEDRHRGLSAFVVKIDSPGLTVGAIKQSNGSMELAEVFFDDMFVADAARVGEERQGWTVAMHILAGERGSYTWLRQSEMLPRLEKLAALPQANRHTTRLGESLMKLIALRCRAREVMEILASGEAPGPESSVSKVLAIDGEQYFYESAREIMSPALDLGTAEEADFWQEHYLYSRAASVYGGSRQIQLNVIGKLMITRGVSAGVARESEDLAAVRESVSEAIEQNGSGRAALDGLDWWAFAASPEDAFGRDAFSAWFEAQGAQHTTSPALAGVRGAAVAAALKTDPATVAWTIADTGDDLLVTGFDENTQWVIDDRGTTTLAHNIPDAAQAVASASTALDPGLVLRIQLDTTAGQSVEVDPKAHSRAEDLARIAASYEILGASRRLLEMAIQHSNEREQFGQPIAQFQAIQHLISECQIEISSHEAVCRAALEEWSAGVHPDIASLAKIAKAQAGRDGRNIAQRALQCFGAIGFTDEHDHHLYSRRIHTLDVLFGSYPELRDALGAEMIATGRAPRGIHAWHPASRPE
jgi:alkylation response protein AidB-like acyl-CoA dehydrogenase